MTLPPAFDLAQMCADLAAVLDVAPETLTPDTNLMDAGLDSMRAMTVIGQWMDAGIAIDLGDLIAVAPTLSSWWQVISERQTQA